MLIALGLNHNSASVAVRERLAFTADELGLALEAAAGSGFAEHDCLAELAIVATCGRTELYGVLRDPAAHPSDGFEVLLEMLASSRGVDRDTLIPHIYRHAGDDVFAHLCRVAAGIDSMVIGESEILGQISGSLSAAERAGTAGAELRRVFERAVRAGRRARAETAIGRRAVSVSSEAVRLAADLSGSLAGCHVLIVGTGPTARSAGEAVRARGVGRLSVASRTRAHADALAGALEAHPLAWHDLASGIAAADIVVAATGAPHAVITAELVAAAVANRDAGRPLLLLDIAMPRDVEPAVADLPGVRVHDLDDLHARLACNHDLRRQAIPQVQRILLEELAHYQAWQRSTALRPVLVAMRRQAEAIRRREVERALRGVRDVDPVLRQRIEHLSEALVRQLLHEPTRRLREETDPAVVSTYVKATRELFGLGEESERDRIAGAPRPVAGGA